MEFISAEEFLKQDQEVQKVFLDWFENEACSYDTPGKHRRLCRTSRTFQPAISG